MTKAEERALEAYPIKTTIVRKKIAVGAYEPYEIDENSTNRQIYVKGYEQAEKDLVLTWEDIQLLDHFVLELVREEKEGKDWGDGKKFYTEVLTRFKQFKEAKK